MSTLGWADIFYVKLKESYAQVLSNKVHEPGHTWWAESGRANFAEF